LPTHLSLSAHTTSVQTPVRAQLTPYGIESTAMRFGRGRDTQSRSMADVARVANFQPLGAFEARRGGVAWKRQKTRDPLLVWQRYGRGQHVRVRNGKHATLEIVAPVEDQRHEVFWPSTLSCRGRSGARCGDTRTDRAIYDDERAIQLDRSGTRHKFRTHGGCAGRSVGNAAAGRSLCSGRCSPSSTIRVASPRRSTHPMRGFIVWISPPRLARIRCRRARRGIRRDNNIRRTFRFLINIARVGALGQ